MFVITVQSFPSVVISVRWSAWQCSEKGESHANSWLSQQHTESFNCLLVTQNIACHRTCCLQLKTLNNTSSMTASQTQLMTAMETYMHITNTLHMPKLCILCVLLVPSISKKPQCTNNELRKYCFTVGMAGPLNSSKYYQRPAMYSTREVLRLNTVSNRVLEQA